MKSKYTTLTPHLKFYLNFGEDLEYTLFRLTGLEPAGLQNRLKTRDFDDVFINNFIDEPSSEKRKTILREYLTKYYTVNKNQMLDRVREYQKIWDEKSENFFTAVNKIAAPFKWSFDEYDYLVSSFYSRAPWGKVNKFAVRWIRDPKKYYFLNGYELILTHFFEIVDQIYPKRPVGNWYLWALAESTAYLFIYKSQVVKDSFYPKLSEPENFSYPQLYKHIAKLETILASSKNFEDYITKSIEYIKDFDERDLTTPHK